MPKKRRKIVFQSPTSPVANEHIAFKFSNEVLESEDRIPPAPTPTSHYKKLPSSPEPRRSLQALQISLQSPQEQPRVPTYSTSSSGAKPVQ